MVPKAGKKFPVVKDGEWVRPRRRGWLMKCCDCGLVHRVNFRLLIERGRPVIELQAFRCVDNGKV